ncbi:MAG: 4Fe-4S binding protein [Chloroflexi bacterium]|nr:4Fe-4S binding protein [Chloroflexota bacterium]
MSILSIRESGKKVLATGNEAIARGAIEAGIGYASTYPGTPASQIGDSFYAAQSELPWLHFEYSMNEKIAVEGAIGAAWSGVRAIASMKAPGLNVAAEPLFTVCYYGARGLVIVNGADPGQQASSAEQDNRWYSLSTHMPCLEPSTIQEAKDFTFKAFELSEEFGVPFMINLPTDLCHASGMLILGEFPRALPFRGKFGGAVVARTLRGVEGSVHRKLLETEERIKEYALHSPLNEVLPGSDKWGVISSGMAWSYTLEALNILGLYDVPVLKLGMVYPISPELIARFAEGLDQVIVVEELDPFIETAVEKIAYERGLKIPIVGKDLMPKTGALSPTTVALRLSEHSGLPLPSRFSAGIARREAMARTPGMISSQREGGLCAGCSHRGAAYALKKATGGNLVCGGDIGCYGNLSKEPWSLSDWSICMGAGIGIAQGVSHKVDDLPVVALIGDSTFFHAGLPSVLNAAYHRANVLLLLLDNRWTALTGHQPCPSTVETVEGAPLKAIDIKEMLQGLGVEHVITADPFKPNEMARTISEAITLPGLKVIITEGECVLQSQRRDRLLGAPTKVYRIDSELCGQCDLCYSEFRCPAMERRENGGSTAYLIDPGACVGCGGCVEICPFDAIVVAE